MNGRPWVPHPRHPNAIPPVPPLAREIAELIAGVNPHAWSALTILTRCWCVDYDEVE
jgi:hypothetical protein